MLPNQNVSWNVANKFWKKKFPKIMDIYEYHNGCEILLPKKEKKRKAGLHINSL
jgi:hypothetical protein